jgi:hypothetical protein
VAVRATREIVIEAPPEAIMDALADVEALPSYAPAYRRAEVLDRYEDGRPHPVRIAVKVLGLLDEEVLESAGAQIGWSGMPIGRHSSTPNTSSTGCGLTTPAHPPW